MAWGRWEAEALLASTEVNPGVVGLVGEDALVGEVVGLDDDTNCRGALVGEGDLCLAFR